MFNTVVESRVDRLLTLLCFYFQRVCLVNPWKYSVISSREITTFSERDDSPLLLFEEGSGGVFPSPKESLLFAADKVSLKEFWGFMRICFWFVSWGTHSISTERALSRRIDANEWKWLSEAVYLILGVVFIGFGIPDKTFLNEIGKQPISVETFTLIQRVERECQVSQSVSQSVWAVSASQLYITWKSMIYDRCLWWFCLRVYFCLVTWWLLLFQAFPPSTECQNDAMVVTFRCWLLLFQTFHPSTECQNDALVVTVSDVAS